MRVALLYGGKSGEPEISLMSAASVLANLDRQRYTIFPIGMDHDGCVYLNDLKDFAADLKSLPVKTAYAQKLPSLIIDGKFVWDVDVVFPVVHGPLYED